MNRFRATQEPTDVFGLKFRPTINPASDAQDWLEYGWFDGKPVSMNHKHQRIVHEFSDNDKSVLSGVINELKSNNSFNAVLEIGVFRSGEWSSTKVILENKPLLAKYIGVDLNEGCLSPVRDSGRNIFCLCQNSSSIDEIMWFANNVGISGFDLVLIDGNHSINQVMDDWRFAKHLNKGGYVVFHDLNFHAGPRCVFEAIDETLFEKKDWLPDEEFDWGIGTAKKLV